MKKHIIVITTGGTIAMKKDPETGGLVPAVSGEDLAAAVPGLSDWADVSVVEFSNVPSGWMSAEKMFDLSHLIDKLSEEGKADGFVVTHGTDTLEETAFFLDMSLKTEKPVCVTGAMRGASELSADGPENILSAVRTAADDMSKDMGVLVCLQDRIYAAKDVTKSHTTNPDTFRDLNYGPLGAVYGKEIIYGRRPMPHIRLSSGNHRTKRLAHLRMVRYGWGNRQMRRKSRRQRRRHRRPWLRQRTAPLQKRNPCPPRAGHPRSPHHPRPLRKRHAGIQLRRKRPLHERKRHYPGRRPLRLESPTSPRPCPW